MDQQGAHQSASGHHRVLSPVLPGMLRSIDPVLLCGAGHTRLMQTTPLQRPRLR